MWRIVNWNEHFENNRSRDIKDCKWVAMPNSHDGDGYTELVDHPNGAAHFGVWCAIVQVASRSKPRGELRRRGGVEFHDTKSLSRITRIGVAVFEEAIPRLVQIGWLEKIPEAVAPQEEASGRQEGAQEGAGAPQEGVLERRKERREGKEGNGREGIESPSATALSLPPILDQPAFRGQLAAWLRYKGKGAYKADGLTAMISRAANRAAEFGAPAVIAAMQTAMANGWKGWDIGSSWPKTKTGNRGDPRGNLAAYQQFVQDQEREFDG